MPDDLAQRIASELLGKRIVPSDAHAHAAKLIVEAHLAAHAQSLDTTKLAERIRLQICAATYAAEGGDWSNTSDESIDAAINYWLGPVLERQQQMVEVLRECRRLLPYGEWSGETGVINEISEAAARIDALLKLVEEGT